MLRSLVGSEMCIRDRIGSISLGTDFDAGSILVPNPAAGITAFLIFIVAPHVKILRHKSFVSNNIVTRNADFCYKVGVDGSQD